MKNLFLLFTFLTLPSITLQSFENYHQDFECCQNGASCLYLGPEVYYSTLRVDNTDSTIGGLIGLDNKNSHVDGMIFGVNGGYEYVGHCGLYANIDLNYGQGSLKHSGDLSRYFHEFDATGLLGYQFGGGECPWLITGYAGLGYLTQNYSLSSPSVKYRYYVAHMAFGVKSKVKFRALDSGWAVGLNVAALPQADSTVKIEVLKGARWTLAKRTDWIVSVPVEYYSDCFPVSVKVDLFWDKIGLGGSKAVTSSGFSLGLPPMRWNAYGASLDLAWMF